MEQSSFLQVENIDYNSFLFKDTDILLENRASGHDDRLRSSPAYLIVFNDSMVLLQGEEEGRRSNLYPSLQPGYPYHAGRCSLQQLLWQVHLGKPDLSAVQSFRNRISPISSKKIDAKIIIYLKILLPLQQIIVKSIIHCIC